MEFLTKIFDGLASASSKLPGTGLRPFFIIALVFIAAIGVIVGLTYFGTPASKMKRACKKIRAFLDGSGVDDDNVAEFTSECFGASSPRALRETWVEYLGVRFGYPSDIISEKDVFDREVKKTGVIRPNIFIGVALALVAVFAFWGMGTIGGPEMGVVLSAGLLLSALIYIILVVIGKKQYKTAKELFYDMQDELDAKVNLQVEKNYATDSSPLQDIAAIVDEIIARNTGRPAPVVTEADIEEEPSATGVVANERKDGETADEGNDEPAAEAEAPEEEVYEEAHPDDTPSDAEDDYYAEDGYSDEPAPEDDREPEYDAEPELYNSEPVEYRNETVDENPDALHDSDAAATEEREVPDAQDTYYAPIDEPEVTEEDEYEEELLADTPEANRAEDEYRPEEGFVLSAEEAESDAPEEASEVSEDTAAREWVVAESADESAEPEELYPAAASIALSEEEDEAPEPDVSEEGGDDSEPDTADNASAEFSAVPDAEAEDAAYTVAESDEPSDPDAEDESPADADSFQEAGAEEAAEESGEQNETPADGSPLSEEDSPEDFIDRDITDKEESDDMFGKKKREQARTEDTRVFLESELELESELITDEEDSPAENPPFDAVSTAEAPLAAEAPAEETAAAPEPETTEPEAESEAADTAAPEAPEMITRLAPVIEVVEENLDEGDENVRLPRLGKLPPFLDYVLTLKLSRKMKINLAMLMLNTYKSVQNDPEDKEIALLCLKKIMTMLMSK